MSALKKKIKKRIAKKKFRFLSKKSLQLEYLFIISEIFLEFIYKLHILKMSMKPNHPLKSQLSIDWNESKNKKNSIKTTKFKFGFEKLKKKSMGKKPKQIMYDCHTERKENPLIFFSIRFTMTQKIIPLFRTRLKNKRTLPTIYWIEKPSQLNSPKFSVQEPHKRIFVMTNKKYIFLQ